MSYNQALDAATTPGPPRSQEEVVARLLELFEGLPTQLQIAARFVIDHPHEVGVRTMRSLAGDAGIHPNSFMRLARQLGFDGYEAMRERFRDFVRGGIGSSPDRAKWLQTLARDGGSGAIVGEMAAACLDNTERMFARQSTQDLDRAVEWMVSAKRVFILGLGLAYPLAYNFWYVGRMAFDHFVLTPRHGTLCTDDLIRAGERDCLVAMTFQPYRKETIAATRLCRSRGTRVIGISDSVTSPLHREADLGLVSPTHTPQFFQSNSAVTALVELLCALLVVRGSQSATRAIEDFHAARWDAEVYEES